MNIHKMWNIYFGKILGINAILDDNKKIKTVKINNKIVKIDKNKFFG